MQIEDPPQNLIPKEKAQRNKNWARLQKFEVSTDTIISQILYVNPINRVMSMEQIFQNFSKQMLKITYTLRLGQLLTITPDLKRYMW
jgi:hypothetical protein